MGETAEDLRNDIAATRYEMSGTLEAIGDRVSPGRIVERRRNRVVLWYRDAKDRVMGAADDMQGSMSDMRGSLSEGASQVGHAPQAMVSGTKERVQGSPMIAGAIAFGVGALFGSLFPASDTERRLGQKAMQAAEPIKSELQESGHDVADHLREPVRDAIDDVKQSATQSAQQVRDSARDSAEHVRQQAQS